MMHTPKMILFDYGQTLVSEQKFDGVKGTEAVLRYATKNKYNLNAETVQRHAEELLRKLGRLDPATNNSTLKTEIPNTMFTPYLYESLGIELSLSNEELDRIFWDAAAPGEPTEGVREFLGFLRENGIRTGVISNISYAYQVVEERIRGLFPEHEFEFILASSRYMFRKPHRRIFQLALEKASLKPHEVWYIGDNYECDICGAKNAGLFAVWYIGAIDIPSTEHEDAFIVRRWPEVTKKILTLEPKED